MWLSHLQSVVKKKCEAGRQCRHLDAQSTSASSRQCELIWSNIRHPEEGDGAKGAKKSLEIGGLHTWPSPRRPGFMPCMKPKVSDLFLNRNKFLAPKPN